MSLFQNILVGVDLSHGDWLCSDDGETPSHFVCSQAIALAAATIAAGHPAPQLHFLAALDLDERTKWLLEQQPDEGSNVVTQAEAALRQQVNTAAKDGVAATSSVVLGRSRVELVNAAQNNNHDLVIVGSRGRGLLSGVFMGSTAIELLRKSTCPVWVVKQYAPGVPRRILVGTDFSPICGKLFDTAVDLSKVFDAELHVTHVVESAARPFLQFSNVAEQAIHEAHEQALARAQKELEALASREDVAELSKPLVVHLEEGAASEIITAQTINLEVDLVLIGMIAWAGVPGLVFGSTCQKMLPSLTCSLLTMRPEEVD